LNASLINPYKTSRCAGCCTV